MLLLTAPITAVPWAVVDVETTGLEPGLGDRVCEIAVLRAAPQQEPRLFCSLVNPHRPISPGARAVNGLTNTDVAGAPSFPSLIPEISHQLDGAVLVAHNAPFAL